MGLATMSLSLASTSTSYASGVSKWQLQKYNILQLSQALQNGDYSSAQSAFRGYVNNAASPVNPQSVMGRLGAALQSGNVSAAQRIFTSTHLQAEDFPEDSQSNESGRSKAAYSNPLPLPPPTKLDQQLGHLLSALMMNSSFRFSDAAPVETTIQPSREDAGQQSSPEVLPPPTTAAALLTRLIQSMTGSAEGEYAQTQTNSPLYKGNIVNLLV